MATKEVGIVLYVITNRKLASSSKKYFHNIKECINNNVEAIVIREKDINEDDLEVICKKIVSLRNEIKKENKDNKINTTKLIINSNLVMAKKYNLDGVQIPYDKFVMEYGFKENLHFKGQLGIAVHSVEEALDSFKRNADYIIIGHIFETNCKAGLTPRGLDIIKDIRKNTNRHIVAIGGINNNNFLSAINSGANSVAMMSGIMCCHDINKFLKEIYREINT